MLRTSKLRNKAKRFDKAQVAIIRGSRSTAARPFFINRLTSPPKLFELSAENYAY